MNDLTTTYEGTFFRARWNPDIGSCGGWRCDCDLFRLSIEVAPDAPCGIVYSYRDNEHDRDPTILDAIDVRQDLIDQAKRAVSTHA